MIENFFSTFPLITSYVHLLEAVVMFAPDEAVNGQVVVKSLATGEQTAHPIGNIVEAVRESLKGPI